MEEIDIWPAAKQMMELYPEDATATASRRAGMALDQSDMFNFEIWTLIIVVSDHRKPAMGELPGGSVSKPYPIDEVVSTLRQMAA